MKNVIGAKLSEIRKKKGLTQEEVAEKAGISLRTIQRIELGETNPRGFTLSAICRILDVNIENLQDYGKVEDKSFFSYLHLSVMAGAFIPLGDIIVPGIIWLSKKDRIAGLDIQGKNMLLFRILFDLTIFILFTVVILQSILNRMYLWMYLFAAVYYLMTLAYPIFAALAVRHSGKLHSYYPSFFR